MKKAKVALVGMLMLAGSGAYAQTNGIGGTVTDNAGEPIIGASVKVKGSTNMGTVTDIDGNFKLDVKPGETLIISYIGCKDQEVKAGENLKIVLQDNSEVLGEVVVTGYQVQRKADLTGAVSVMDMSKPTSEANANMLSSMQVVSRHRSYAFASRQGAGHDYHHRRFANWHRYGSHSWYRFVQFFSRSSLCYRRCAYHHNPQLAQHERY